MAVEVWLLGEVGVRLDERAVDIGHARQRCVLAALVVDAGRVVPTGTLIDRVWAGNAPQHARNALSGYISRLRRALEPAGVALHRERNGYRLMIDPMAVDLHRFRGLVAQAYSAGDDEQALDRFDRALGLWRGDAVATLDGPWPDRLRVALAAERHAVELDRTDLALRLGRHTDLVARLHTAADAHPLDERLAGQLMHALYRCGRQADALLHYQRIRTALAGELGTEPCAPLRELHQRMLRIDPGLDGPSRAGRPVPRQLPARPRSFTGRDRELGRLDAIMADAGTPPTAVVVAVSGAAGVGKTALALQWAHRVSDRFPDGQLYVNLRGFDRSEPATPADVVQGFLDALGVAPDHVPVEPDARVALYRSLLADRRMLVLLDNARTTDQVRELLPGSPGCLVLVTSRDRLTGLVAVDSAHPLVVDLLTGDEARVLLAARIGADRVAAEPDAVREVIDRCAGLPLALAIVAARAAVRPCFPIQMLAEELREPHGLDALAVADPHTDPRAVFSWSYRVLRPPAARMFRLLGSHLGPEVSLPAAASLAGVPVGEARALLGELADAHLITEHLPHRYTMHDLLFTYAAELNSAYDSDSERRLATRRMLDHYLHTAHAADQVLLPHRHRAGLDPAAAGVTPENFTGHQAAMRWFTVERPVLLGAVRCAAETGFAGHTWRLARTLNTFLGRRAHWTDWVAVQSVAVDAARRLGERQAQAYAHTSLGYANGELLRFDDAHSHLDRALKLQAGLGDLDAQVVTQLAHAWCFGRQSRWTEALRHGTAALRLCAESGNRVGRAKALNAMAWFQAELGADAEAVRSCEEAIRLQQQTGDRYNEAATWDTLGFAHHRFHRYDKANACYYRAMDIHAAVGDRYDETVVLAHIADTHRATGELALAEAAWHRALNILTELGHPDADKIRAALGGYRGCTA